MGPSLASHWTQMFPPQAPIYRERPAESSCESESSQPPTQRPPLSGLIADWLSSQVYIVTGSSSGVGKQLARMLYSRNAKIYIAARSEDKANKAIEEIKNAAPLSTGALVFLRLDLTDLTTIKASAENFLSRERKLHVLFNNAGVMASDQGPSKSAQGYEIQLGINNIGNFMFTKLLTPTLVATASSEPPNTVRVVWVSSAAAEIYAHQSIAIPLDNLDYHIDKSVHYKYGISKTGNYLHAVEFATRYKADGVISIPLNPGNLTSDLYRDQGLMLTLLSKLVGYPPVFGACTELFAGLSPNITTEKSGSWVVPFGRFYPIRKDLLDATKSEAEGGNGSGKKFWEWTEDQVRAYI